MLSQLSTRRYLMKSLHFRKADSTKFHHNSLRHYYISNQKFLNNLIIKTQYNYYYSSSSGRNAPPRTTESSTTKAPTIISNLKNDKEQLLSKRIREVINSIKVKNTDHALRVASKILNEFTGYSTVEKLKEKVIQQEQEFVTTRQRLSSAKLAYEEAVTARSATQREINDLLHRKNQWSNEDVVRFTELYRNEHLNEQTEVAAKKEFQQCEKQVEKEYTDLTRSIMMRYHEEQVWSDKIRSASTYGTIALMTLNIILFICVQTVFEPRKRQKLVDKYEELLVKKLDGDDNNKLKAGIFRPLYQKLEQMDERISQLLSANYPFSVRQQDEPMVGLESPSPENELSIDNILLEDTEEACDPKKDILLTRGELDKIVILSTLLGAGAGWMLSFIFSERFNR